MQQSDYDHLYVDGTTYQTRLTTKYQRRKPVRSRTPREVRAFIPATVAEILVQPEQRISQGETLLILEAMKMRNPVNAPADARVRTVHVEVGDRVTKGQLLIELELSNGDAS